jgi:YD repeat-containing protein
MRFNHLLKFRDQSYSYHPYGSVKSKQNNDVTSTTAYNAEHRLSKARIEHSGHNQRYGYVYDALGRRIEKHQLDTSGDQPYNRTHFLWNGLTMIRKPARISTVASISTQTRNNCKPRASIDKRGSEDEEIAYYHTDLNRSRKNLTMQTVKYCGNVAVSYGVNDFRKLSKNQ